MTLLRQKMEDTTKGISKYRKGSYVNNNLIRVAFLAAAISTTSGLAEAKIVECTFYKVTSNGMGDRKNTRGFLGEAIIFDTTKRLVRVRWSTGSSKWMLPGEVSKNQSFTSYVVYQDVEYSDGTMPTKFVFRLSADETGAEVRSEIQKRARAGWEWSQNAARYKCAEG
jgi:hypothetical protein